MIRAPFMQDPDAWLRATRESYDKVRYACPIEVGRRPLGFYLWRWLKGIFK